MSTARLKNWTPSPIPNKVEFGYDILDKALLFRATREQRTITANLMNELYPGWKWGKSTKLYSQRDNSKKVRRPEDVTIEEVLRVFFQHDSFTTPLWKMIEGRTSDVEVREEDLVMFLKVHPTPLYPPPRTTFNPYPASLFLPSKVFCCLMFYKCTIREYFNDPDHMYKRFPMSENITERKFRAILGSFRSHHDRGRRRKLNHFMAQQRKRFSSLLYDKLHCMTSLDDDKQRMRSFKCQEEGFTRQRHAKGGGFGPVQHVAVSQLSHFVIGAIINSQGSSDADTLEQLLFDMDGEAQVLWAYTVVGSFSIFLCFQPTCTTSTSPPPLTRPFLHCR